MAHVLVDIRTTSDTMLWLGLIPLGLCGEPGGWLGDRGSFEAAVQQHHDGCIP